MWPCCCREEARGHTGSLLWNEPSVYQSLSLCPRLDISHDYHRGFVALLITLGKKCRCYCPRMGPVATRTRKAWMLSVTGGQGGAFEPRLTHLPEVHRSEENWALTTGQGAELSTVITQDIQGQEEIAVASSKYTVPSWVRRTTTAPWRPLAMSSPLALRAEP